MACSHRKKCQLFSQFVMHPALFIWQDRYCDADFHRCVRFIKSEKGFTVPVTLLPNGRLLDVRQTEDEVRGNILFNAVVKNRSWMLKSLLEKLGADVNYQNRYGMSALMIAAENGQEQMLEILLEHGADATLTTVSGETAAQLAERKGFRDVAATLRAWHGENAGGGKSLWRKTPRQFSPATAKQKGVQV